MSRTETSAVLLTTAIASRTAHELNNIASVLTGHIYLLSEGAESIAESCEALEKAMKHLARLTACLTSVGSLGREDVAALDVSEILAEATRSCPLPVDLDLERDLPSVSGRRGDLLRAIEALLANSCEAGGSGQRIRVAARVEGASLALVVEDRGSGVPAEVRRRNFEPLYSTKGEKGRGIGITLATAVAQEHGGSLVIEPVDEGGTRAVLRISLAG